VFSAKFCTKWFIRGLAAMPSSPFSENCKPPKPPILASLSGGLSVKNLFCMFLEDIPNKTMPKI